MTPAAPWQAAAVALLGGDPSGARWANLGGTPLNATWRLDVGLDRFFVKTNTAAPPADVASRGRRPARTGAGRGHPRAGAGGLRSGRRRRLPRARMAHASFVTGEGAAHTYFDAMEFGVNVLYAGHYATETIGVRHLAEHLATRFGLPWEFHDHPTGM